MEPEIPLGRLCAVQNVCDEHSVCWAPSEIVLLCAVTRIKISKSRTGQKHSEETRQKMSVARKEYWDKKHQEQRMLQDDMPRGQQIDAESKMANSQS